jgi:hypothetical protein
MEKKWLWFNLRVFGKWFKELRKLNKINPDSQSPLSSTETPK